MIMALLNLHQLLVGVLFFFFSVLGGIQPAATAVASSTTPSSTRFTEIMKRSSIIITNNNPSSSSAIVNRIRLLGRRTRDPTKQQHGRMMHHRNRLSSSSCSAMAFCNVHTVRRIPSVHHHSATLLTTSSSSLSLYASSTISSSSSSDDNYYTAASSISNFSTSFSPSSPPTVTQNTQNTDESFPSWWPISQSMSKYVTFSDHIAHVIIPDATASDATSVQNSNPAEEISEGMTCGQVIEWVVRAARNRNASETTDDDALLLFHDENNNNEDDSYTTQRYNAITNEYQQGQQSSSSSSSISTTNNNNKVLDPAYRHDPNSFPQLTHYANNLTPAELLAMGSIWSLPYSASLPKKSKSSSSSSSSSTTIMMSSLDRFNPSNGVKPTRLTVGNYNDTVYGGDYFRVHFNPRRFVDTNKYDWSGPDGVVSSSSSSDKPGVIVRRDDEAGYLIINKPPNIPAHARVDNLLENVASSVGRMLWLERREEILLSNNSNRNNGDDDDDLTMMVSSSSDGENNEDDDVVEVWPSGMRKKKKKNNNNQKQQKSDQLVYVATPQRLDQNTSGILVVATKKSFASYFAKLLRTKTSGQLQSGGTSQSSCGVHKSYRCLVCVTPKYDNAAAASSSMAGEVERLKRFEEEGTIIKHFLEPSIRAPKHFVESVPQDADNPESWSECLLKITNIKNVCTVVGNDPSDALATDLWGEFGKPNDCVGILELEIELLTGRTHQIRGQMAALGFPLVGDVQYGGAIPNTSSEYTKTCRGRAEGFLDSETLALQCSTLEFLDPDATDDAEKVERSDRWLSFHLDTAFWTPFIERYHTGSGSLSGSSMTFEGFGLKDEARGEEERTAAPSTDDQLLPPRVQLSPGSHKYVVIRATTTNAINADKELWFVRSASPEECGGPYHANVAQDLLNRLKSLGYSSTVMGGGRIDFLDNDEVSHAHVFGFSYGFGKGDHEKVAKIIEENTDIIATSDMSDGLH